MFVVLYVLNIKIHIKHYTSVDNSNLNIYWLYSVYSTLCINKINKDDNIKKER